MYSVRIQENTDQKKLRIETLFKQGMFLANIWDFTIVLARRDRTQIERT